jgi:tetratricopeptide (TPR) repeat protein
MNDKVALIEYGALSLAGLGGLLWSLGCLFSYRISRNTPVWRGFITLELCLGEVYLMPKLYRSGLGVGGWLDLMVFIVTLVFLFLLWTGFFANRIVKLAPKPYYSSALAQRQRGQYAEALAVIREELARFPGDYTGVALLARIQAEDQKDLAAAERTLNEFCAGPETPPNQFAAAQTQLADWQLQLAQDIPAARRALEKIGARYPASELALRAAQRLAHLEGAAIFMQAKRDRPTIAVPAGVPNLGLLESPVLLQPLAPDPVTLINGYVKHLAAHPDDTEVRELLAVAYADHCQRLDLATAELFHLISIPHQPDKRVAHWLTLLANLQIQHHADYDTVRLTLEKIVTAFPGQPAAHAAQARLNHLHQVLKGAEAPGPAKKLGVYEQNLGLKSGSPSQR